MHIWKALGLALLILLLGAIGGAALGNLELGINTAGAVISVALLALIGLWEGAKKDIGPVVAVRRNQIVAIDQGQGNPVKILANLPPGYEVNAQMEVIDVPQRAQRKKTFLEEFGLYWKGWPPLKVHEFMFLHERMNSRITQDTKPEEWVVRDRAPVPIRHLLWDKQHDFVIPEVEFKGGLKANIMVNARFLSRKPLISIYDREGKFFEVMMPIIHGAVMGTASSLDYKTEFSEAGETQRRAFTDSIIRIANLEALLVDQTGQEMVSATISRQNPSSEVDAKLLRAEKEAEIRKKVAITEAQGDVADVTEMAKALKRSFNTADQDLILAMVKEISIATRMKEAGEQAMNVAAMLNMTGGRNNNTSTNNKQSGKKGPGKRGTKKP